MLWGLDRDAWISIWSGALGAIPAAVLAAAVAAWVAVTVLNRSNAHQRDLAEQAASEQRLAAERALLEQRAQMTQQLDEQRRLAELQLSEQRNEAGDVRRKAAMAELISVATGFAVAADAGETAVREQRLLFARNAYRWGFEVSQTDPREEILEWGDLLFIVALHLSGVSTVPPSTRRAWSSFLAETMGAFSGLALGLVAAGRVVPQEIIDHIAIRREKLSSRWKDELVVLPWAGGVDSSAGSSEHTNS